MTTDDAPLLRDTTDELLARATEDNLFALFGAMARWLPDGELERHPGLCRHHSGPSNPMFKGAWATRLSPDEVDAAIDDTIAWFQARRAPYFFWWTGPSSAPATLGARLQARGLLDMAEQSKPWPPGSARPRTGRPSWSPRCRTWTRTCSPARPPPIGWSKWPTTAPSPTSATSS